MSAADRAAVISRHGLGLFFIVGAYFLVSIVRGIRADFAREIWRGLGTTVAAIDVRDLRNRGRASSCCRERHDRAHRRQSAGLLRRRLGSRWPAAFLMLIALAGLSLSRIDGFTFMALLGTGLYLALRRRSYDHLRAADRDDAQPVATWGS